MQPRRGVENRVRAVVGSWPTHGRGRLGTHVAPVVPAVGVGVVPGGNASTREILVGEPRRPLVARLALAAGVLDFVGDPPGLAVHVSRAVPSVVVLAAEAEFACPELPDDLSGLGLPLVMRVAVRRALPTSRPRARAKAKTKTRSKPSSRRRSHPAQSQRADELSKVHCRFAAAPAGAASVPAGRSRVGRGSARRRSWGASRQKSNSTSISCSVGP
jgi:hypothetical protein